MSLDDPVVITCSISGSIANRDQCPAIPYTPEELIGIAEREYAFSLSEAKKAARES